MTTSKENFSPQEAKEEPQEGGMDILSFLKEKRPPREMKETSPEQVGLIDSLKKKVDSYKNKLIESGAKEDAVDSLATEYAHELKQSQQDPRKYIDLGNRTYANGRLNEEITALIPEDRELTLDDLDRVYRLDHDLDEFKTINDYYGHKAGDDILHTYSEILKKGESVEWIKNTGLLVEKSENEPQAFEATVEGGEEFGGLLVFKEEFSPLELEDGTKLNSREEVVREFVKKIQKETKAKFKDLLAQKDAEGNPKYPLKGKVPEGIKLPEDFVVESGTSFGYASVKEATENIEIYEEDDYDTVMQKIRSHLFERSDKRAYGDKLERKIQREQSDDINAKLTAEISPRGRAEMLERKNIELSEQTKKDQEKIEAGNSAVAKLESQLAGLKSAFESIKEQQGYELVRDTLLTQITAMEATIESFKQAA